MSPKGKYGYYITKQKGSCRDYVIYWPDESGWFVNDCIDDVWNKGGDGWPRPYEELEGAALVAPLSILFWEDE